MKLLISSLSLMCAISAAAQVQWLETEHDFGAFHEADGPARCEFRFVNRGSEDVAIIGARANCGCTTPQYPVDPIAPGDTAAISVAYDPAARPGRFTKYVQVDVSGQPRQKLSVTGVVIGEPSSVGWQYPADFGPLKLRRGAMMLGQVEKGRLKTASVNMYNSTADSLRPEFTAMPDYIDVALVPEVIPPGEQATLMVYFRSHKCPLYGLVESSIDIIPDPSAADSAYSFPVTAIVNENFDRLTPADIEKAPRAVLSDSSYDFGTLSRGSAATAEGRVRLTNSGKSPLNIRRIYTTDPGISLRCDSDKVKKGKGADIIIGLRPEEISGNLVNAKVSVITDDPLNPVQTLRITGIFQP